MWTVASPNHPQPVRGIATNGTPLPTPDEEESQPPPTRPRDCNKRNSPSLFDLIEVPTTPNPSEGLQLPDGQGFVAAGEVPTTPNPSEGLQLGKTRTQIELLRRPNHPQPVRGIATRGEIESGERALCPNHPQPVRGIATATSDRSARRKERPNHPQPVRGIATPENRPGLPSILASQPPPTRPRDCNGNG